MQKHSSGNIFKEKTNWRLGIDRNQEREGYWNEEGERGDKPTQILQK